MERNREGRRSNVAQSNGLHKRRQRNNNIRLSPDFRLFLFYFILSVFFGV